MTFSILIIFFPIIFSVLIYITKNRFSLILAFMNQGLLTYLMFAFLKLNQKDVIYFINMGGWSRIIGISFKVDTLSISFIVFSIITWWVILIYSCKKISHDYKFAFFLVFLEGVFLGLVQTNDFFSVFVFVELITIISAILIIYKKDGHSVRAGFYYLLFNSIGMLFYLVGLCLLYNLVGSLNMEVVKIWIFPYRNSFTIKIAFIFIMSGLGVKSAFFPVYNWLPKAHGAAPASISALLSGLLVKSGLYVFIRVNEIFMQTQFERIFLYVGFITALGGVIFALSQKDIKQILAFHTISQVGIILIGLSGSFSKIYYGGLLHLFNHGFFKALLFLGAGFIINEFKTRRVTELRGVFRTFPMTSTLMIVGMFSITGAPFFSGYISKSMIKYGFIDAMELTLMLNIINSGTIISFIKISQIFFGEKRKGKGEKFYVNVSMGVLAILCIILGNFPELVVEGLWYSNLNMSNIFTLNDFMEYIGNLLLGWLIYKQIIEKDYGIIKRIRHFNLSFGTSIFLMVTFIFSLIAYTVYLEKI